MTAETFLARQMRLAREWYGVTRGSDSVRVCDLDVRRLDDGALEIIPVLRSRHRIAAMKQRATKHRLNQLSALTQEMGLYDEISPT